MANRSFEGCVRRSRVYVHRSSVLFVIAGNDAEHQRGVLYRPADRTDVVQRPGKRNHSTITHAAVGGFESHDPTVTSGNTDTSGSVGA